MTTFSVYQKLLVLGLFSATIFFGFFRLSESPPLNADEGYFIQSATNSAEFGIQGLQLAPSYIDPLSATNSSGYPLTYTLGLWFKIFGAGILNGRILMVFFLLGFVALSFVLVRKMYGNAMAIATLALIATFPPLYGNGKAVMGEMPGMFFMVASLFLFHRAIHATSRKTVWIMVAGIFAGLFIATKVAFILCIPALAVIAFVEWRRKSLPYRDIGVAVISTLVPIVILIVSKFQPGDSLSTVLSFYANPSHISNLSETVLKNVKALFTDVGPLYTTGMISIWFVSLCVRWRTKIKIASIEAAAFVFVVLNVLSFTRTAGFYRYLFPAQIISLVFFPHALSIVLETLSRTLRVLKKPMIFTICIVVLSVFGLYQLCFDSYVADAYDSHKIAELQSYFDTIPATTTVFFYNSEGLVPFFQGRNYYQYLMFFNQEDWTAGSENLQVLMSGEADLIVSGVHSAGDEKAGVFDKYVTLRTFDKVTIMERRK
jgi:4-amino-4-deoxy-L-arabinose transferase-like glycosyltransferase